jgi:hypothetical protein
LNPHKNHKSINKFLNAPQREEGLKDQDSLESKIINLKKLGNSQKTPKLRLKIKRLLKDKKKDLSMSKTLDLMIINELAYFYLYNHRKAYESLEVERFSIF